MLEDWIKDFRNKKYTVDNMGEVAEKVLDKFEIDQVPVPIISIIKKLGFQVYQQKMEDELSGFIVVDDQWKDRFGTNKLVLVNSEHNNGHKRFTIAHELAHYLFDYDEKKPSYYNAYYKNSDRLPDERCANQFAANLLMPKNLFIDEYNKAKKLDVNIVAMLADKFEVSAKAAERRLEELKLG